MGARISVTGPGRSMYLVVGRGTSLDTIVRTAGGEVVLRLNGWKMLVMLPFIAYLSLRSSHEIAHIGPVTIDVKRLAKLAEIMAKTTGPGPANTG